MKYLILTLLVMPFIAVTVHAGEALKVGQSIPETSGLTNQFGEESDINALIGEAGAVLVFYRSADWCPYCKAQLIDLRNNRDKFEDEGFSIIGVSYDKVEALGKFDKQHDPGFNLLSDPNSEAIKAFGIFDEGQREGGFSYGIPHPTIFVVDKDGQIQAVLAEESYKTRPQIDSIMEEIYKAKGKTQ